MRILVFCADVLPLDGLPSSGGGIRSYQWVRCLEQCGHEVIAYEPFFTYLSQIHIKEIPQHRLARSWEATNQDEIIRQIEPDCIVFASSWITDHSSPNDGCIRFYDLNGPMMMERHYKNEPDWDIHLQDKIERIQRADYVFTANERQRYYLFPYLMMAGFSPEDIDERLRILSLSVPGSEGNDGSRFQRFSNSRKCVVGGGGFYPWQNNWNWMEMAAQYTMESELKLLVAGTTHEIDPEIDSSMEQRVTDFQSCYRSPSIEWIGYNSWEDYRSVLTNCCVAIDLFEKNPERELALPTRTIDFLSCGLPVIYPRYGVLADQIEQFGAGWIVNIDDKNQFQNILQQIGTMTEEELKQMSQGATALWKAHYSDETNRSKMESIFSDLSARSKNSRTYILSEPTMSEYRSRPRSVKEALKKWVHKKIVTNQPS